MAERATTAAASKEPWQKALPDLAEDLKQGRIGFDQLLEVHQGRNGAGGSWTRLRDAYAAAFHEIEAAFESRYGRLQRIAYGPDGSGVALTERPGPAEADPLWKRALGQGEYPEYEVHLRFRPAAKATVLDVQNQCEYFRVQRYRVLHTRYLEPFCERLFDAAQMVMNLDEDQVENLPDQLAAVHKVLEDVHARYDWIQNRAASVNYLRGLGFGLVGVAVALVIGLLITVLARGSPVVVLCMAGGALAAAANAALRLVQGTPTVRGDDSRLLITLFASFRPALGAVFALIAYALIVGTVVPAKVPSDPQTLSWFVIGIAFIAGFSEGFTPDLVERASRQFAGAGSIGAAGRGPAAGDR